jgi:GNAT superfamily N-acetyltransferase
MNLFIKKINRNFYNFGIWVTVKKTFYSLLNPVYRKLTYKIYLIDLNNFNRPPMRSNKFDFKFVKEDDVNIIRQIEDMEEWLHNRIIDKLNNNCICLAAIENDTVAGFLIANPKELNIPWMKYKKSLRGNECYGEQITINKQYRKMGLATSLRLKVFDEIAKRGITKFYVGIPTWNRIIRKSVNKFGFTYLADISYLRVFTCSGFRVARTSK